MSENRYQSGRKESFTVLYNSMIVDARLSLEAKGLFAVMMSRPPDWEFTVSGLAAFTGCGKDKIRRVLRDLETVGYLVREQSHQNNGTFGGNIYVLQDFAPVCGGKMDETQPLSGKPVNGENRQRCFPLPGNSTQRNKDLKNKPPKSPKGETDSGFDRFWAVYPRRTAKARALDAWRKLDVTPELLDTILRAVEIQRNSNQWIRDQGRYIPYPATWLNGHRWEDELPTALPQETGTVGAWKGWGWQ